MCVCEETLPTLVVFTTETQQAGVFLNFTATFVFGTYKTVRSWFGFAHQSQPSPPHKRQR